MPSEDASISWFTRAAARFTTALHSYAPALILFAAAITAGLVLAWVAHGGLVRP